MEKQLIPKLRFPKYSDEWNKDELKKITSYVDYRGRAPKKSEKGHFLVTAKNIKKGFIDYEISKEFVAIEDYSTVMSKGLPNLGDVLFTTEAPMGNVAQINNESIALAQRVIKFRGEITIQNTFLLYYMLSNVFQKIIKKKAIGTTVQGISGKELHKTIIKYPLIEEQQKIAAFLKDIDDKITKLTKKKSLLEQYKKGIMQKIFSQELRFKDDNGNEFPKWQLKKLSNICNYKNGGSFEQYVSNDGIYNLISLNSLDINGKLKPAHKKVTINDNSLDEGDLIMVLSDVAHGYFLGLTDIVPDNTFVLNQRMGALKPKININRYFLKTYINFNQKYFKLMGQGSSQQNLSKGDILKFTVKTPVMEEQTKIANFLSDIDIKIEVLNTKIENSKTFKKGLLQQMFV